MNTNNTSTEARQTRVWILSRTSSDDSSDVGRGREAVPVQIEACRSYAIEHDWTVVGNPADFADQDRSGRTYPTGADADKMAALDIATANYLVAHGISEGKSRRKGLGRILEGIKRGDVLLVRDLTRLARPVPDSMLAPWLRQQLVSKGVRLVSIAEGEQDFGNLAQRLMSGISDTINDAAITKQVAQSKAGLQARRDSGMLYCCPTCYGYRSVGKQRAERVPSQIAVVKRIFAEILAGTSVLGLCRLLNDDKVPTSQGKKWQVKTLRTLLQRPVYAGLQKDSMGRLVESKVFPPCVTVEDWHEAQKAFRRFGKREDKHIHPLSGLPVCGHCGKKMIICRSSAYDTHEDQWYYRCQGAHETGAKGCRDSLIRATLTSRVEGIGGLVECLQPLCTTGMVEAERRRGLSAETVRRADEYRVELATITDRESAVFEDRQSGTIDDAQYAGIMARLRTRRSEVSQLLVKIEKEIANTVSETKDSAAVFVALLRVSPPFVVPPMQYRELIRLAVEQVTVYRDSILVRLVSGGEWGLPRLRIRNSRPLPLPLPVQHQTSTGKIRITYVVPGVDERVVYDDERLMVDLQATGLKAVTLRTIRR
jgi:DNA invertase Pin-like site-specific DNA recombinase